ncbi:MAG: T9SS type A sorting domain-containing protein [Candidatus Kapabacteria bacterium]|nr:T9SS type A sorting domain-containing protein [Candidatus Kapabacteria bacterium]
MLVRIIILFLLSVINAVAQVPDSRGRSFIFSILPNFHNNAAVLDFDLERREEHHVRIVVASDVPTTGEIEFVDTLGVSTILPFSIPRPSEVFSTSVFYRPYELRGFNIGRNNLDFVNSQCNRIAPQHIKVRTNNDVSVYALMQAPFTSDAFMVLPVDALGNDYIIMSYPSSFALDEFGEAVPTSMTPSQYAITAVEDGTTVITTNTAAVVNRSGIDGKDTFLLNAGQSVLVQTDMRVNLSGDLTGSQVISDKPIAVFGGHQRTSLPAGDAFLSSRDCLVEQMNPVRTWGKRAFIAPFRPSSNELPFGSDIYRVVARFNDTRIRANGVEVATINAGEFFESPLTGPIDVRTSRPAMVGAYKKTSSSAGTLDNSNSGDPLLMLVPPEEQFMERYTFVTVQTRQRTAANSNEIRDVYREQWVTVVMPDPPAGTTNPYNLTLNDAPISPTFSPIGQSGWSYAHVRLDDGVQTMTADTLFGIYVYGYGPAVSYGYIGGTAYRPLDVYPPTVSLAQWCDTAAVVFTDSVPGDKGLRNVGIESSTNCIVGLDRDFTSYTPVATISARLANPYLDGEVRARGVDVEDQSDITIITIPGFTIGAVQQGASAQPVDRTWTLPIRRRRCDTIQLENYGASPRTIVAARLTSGEAIDVQLPLTLQPGQRRTLTFCRAYQNEGFFTDTLFIADTCRERPTVAWVIESRPDKVPPRLATTEGNPCDELASITAIDPDEFDYGLQTVRLIPDSSRNVEATVRVVSATQSIISVRRVSHYEDAIWHVEAVDSAGNVTVIGDTIPGFTLRFSGQQDGKAQIDMGSVAVGDLFCKRVTVVNRGLFPQRINHGTMVRNTLMSVPLAQLPMDVLPGDSTTLVICYAPLQLLPMDGDNVGVDADSMLIAGECVGLTLEVIGQPTVKAFDGVSRCDVPVELVASTAPKALALPMPASSELTIVVPRPLSEATIQVIAAGGEVVRTAILSGGASTRAFRLDVTGIPDGMYGVVVSASIGTFIVPVIVQQ